MSREKLQLSGGLSPQHQTYKHQKCFVGFSQSAIWCDDLISACQEILCQPEFNLIIDYAGKNFDPDVTLREKALELIANARYGIYDLSYWQDEQGTWQRWKVLGNDRVYSDWSETRSIINGFWNGRYIK